MNKYEGAAKMWSKLKNIPMKIIFETQILTPFGGECKADFSEELTATIAHLVPALEI